MTAAELAVLLALLLAHLAGDFLLQPLAWVEDRQHRKHRSRHLIHHVLVHGALTFAVLAVAGLSMADAPGLVAALVGAVAVIVSHWLIDLAKARLPPGRLRWFLLDQALHWLVLAGVWLVWLGSARPLDAAVGWLVSPETLGVATAYLLVTRPAAFAIALAMQRWSEQLSAPGTLARAGTRIGMLERTLVLTLALLDQLAAVGFLLVAKSVLRFGDLREAQDRKLTEYVLLGTLLSVTSALLLGLVLRRLLAA
ncbi:DUF3307 domain-containing protein [Billgrantia gudaonensis]|uniref:DUF3307 domain-containing protein n=1 Tax=Billgrantia gudaonensis TaxID=376427 RepID=A0A1G8NHU6_9GAMM|nr:DUF3307 domain-containing protein [Halomonas gudaonensis]SDI79804.1 Protein of unknown function [Halomonas gudaonensis]